MPAHKKKAHLLAFLQHGVNSHATGMWRHAKDKVNWDWTRPPYWQHMARTMERGLFDAIFIADELAPYNNYQSSSDACVKYAVQCPTHEPSTIVPIITTATQHLGVGVTLSTAFEHPYSMVRRLSSLDHLSGGRIAWNIVSSYSRSEWDAYGAQMTLRAGRYERMEEYMEVCYKLWDSWEPDAILADKESGVFADPAKVHEVNHVGEFFRCKGRSFVSRSPQGRPVLWQAGSSDRGRDFAAKHAEAVFAVHPTLARMRQYTEDLNERLYRKFQRPPGSVKLIYGLQTVVAETRRAAQEKHEQLKASIPLEGAVAWISGHFGPDFSKYDLDEYVQNIEIPGIQGLFESVIYARGGEPLTVREAALYYAQGMGMPIVVGTPADVADKIEEYMDEGGADGFMLIAHYTPGCFEEFVDWVVPELQRRNRFRTRYRGTTLREHLLDD
jgi:long-chain alkane monooxygenase